MSINYQDYVGENEWNVPLAPVPPRMKPSLLQRSNTERREPLSMRQIIDSKMLTIHQCLSDITNTFDDGANKINSNMSKIYRVGDGKLLPYESFLEPIQEFDFFIQETIRDLGVEIQDTISHIERINSDVSNNANRAKFKYPLHEQLRPVVQEQLKYTRHRHKLHKKNPGLHTAITGDANRERNRKSKRGGNKMRRKLQNQSRRR